MSSLQIQKMEIEQLYQASDELTRAKQATDPLASKKAEVENLFKAQEQLIRAKQAAARARALELQKHQDHVQGLELFRQAF